MAMPPSKPSVSSSVCPNFLAAAWSTVTAALVTSAPIPSPGKIRILRFIFSRVRLTVPSELRPGSGQLLRRRAHLLFGGNFLRQRGDLIVAKALLTVRQRGEALVHHI